MLKLPHILAALIAAGAITTVDSSLSGQSPAAPPSAKSELRLSDTITGERPDLRGRIAVAVETKEDLLVAQQPCERQVWPYISARCLKAADRQEVRQPVRMITVERSMAGGSELMRIPVNKVQPADRPQGR
jgi:hypothetical protein